MIIYPWISEQQSGSISGPNSLLKYQKSSSALYKSQNWDLEDEIYDEDSFAKLCKSMETEELQTSKGFKNYIKIN